MKRKPLLFSSADVLASRIAAYFTWIRGEYHLEELPVKSSAKATSELTEQKVWDREPEPPTLSGLALFLGFESRQAFEDYETGGRFAAILKRARLQIESEYEKKLHYQSPTGAIFALKSLGWSDKGEPKPADAPGAATTLKIEIIEHGPVPAGCEQEVEV